MHHWLSLLSLLLLFACAKSTENEVQDADFLLVRGISFPKDEWKRVSTPTGGLKKPYFVAVKELATGNCLIVPYGLADEDKDPLPCSTAVAKAASWNQTFRTGGGMPPLTLEDQADGCDVQACAGNPVLRTYCNYYQRKWETLQRGGAITEEARLDSSNEKLAIEACIRALYGA